MHAISVSFVKSVLVVFVYNCARLYQNLSKISRIAVRSNFKRADFG